MAFYQFVDLFEREFGEPDDPNGVTVNGRQGVPRFLFRIALDDDPRAVIPVHATEIRVGEVVETGADHRGAADS